MFVIVCDIVNVLWIDDECYSVGCKFIKIDYYFVVD